MPVAAMYEVFHFLLLFLRFFSTIFSTTGFAVPFKGMFLQPAGAFTNPACDFAAYWYVAFVFVFFLT